jgi:hypothetical protein
VVEVQAEPGGAGRRAGSAAWAGLEGRTLVLHGRDLAPGQVELVRAGDVEPYVEGTRRLAGDPAVRRDPAPRRP